MYSHKKGFVALFFVLGLTTTMLTWVVLSSSSIFEYIHAKQDFEQLYSASIKDVTCADMFIDSLVRGGSIEQTEFYRQLFFGDIVFCRVDSVYKSVINVDLWDLSFTSGKLPVHIQIQNGFVVLL